MKGGSSLAGRHDFVGDDPPDVSRRKGMKGKEAMILTGKPSKFVLYRSPEKKRSEGAGGTGLVLQGTVKYTVLDITVKTIINPLSNQYFLDGLDIDNSLYPHKEKEGIRMEQRARNENKQK